MRKQQRILSIFLVVIMCLQPQVMTAKTNDKSGFKEIRKEKYKKDVLHTYYHEASGLSVLWIENKDVNKAFTLGVKTPTTDDTGVNHIIEHTVFTGSEKYPSPSLFFDANAAYPCTYMNALTSGDMTVFPFATPYDECYEALLSIYLDAVFKPNLLKSPYGFYEEGFHSVPEEDRCGGVVYNEMKGAFGSMDRAIYRQIRQMIFKDSHYIYDSGGNPNDIPKLTYEACLKTYKQYYYPGNMKIIVYGDLPIEKTLDKIASYLSDYEAPQQGIDLGVKKLNDEHTGTFYVLPARDKGCLVKAFVMDEHTSAETMQDLELWMSAYLMGPQSYLQSCLNAQGLHTKWLKDDDVAYPVYALVVNDLPCDKLEKYAAVIDDLFEKTAKRTQANVFLEQDMLKETRWVLEKQEESNNRGIHIAQSVLDGWAHGRSEDQFFIKKGKIERMTAIDQNVGKELLDKAQRYTLFLLPGESEVKDPLSLTPLSEGKWQEIHEKMKKWQQQKNDLAPLQLEKLLISAKDMPKIEKHQDYWTMETRTDTHLTRSQLYLNTSHVPQKELNFLFLYSYLLEESAKELSPFSGNLTTSCTAYPLKEGYWPCLKIAVTTLPEETQHGVIFNQARAGLMIKPESWYRQKLIEFVVNTKAGSRNNTIGTLASLCMAGEDDRSSYLYESNYPFYAYCQNLLSLPHNAWVRQVQRLDAELYQKGGLIISTTLSEKGKNKYQESWEKIISEFPEGTNYKGSYETHVPEGDCMVPAETAVDHSFRALYKKEGVSGTDYLLAAYLTKNYLNPKLRVQMGAYGAGCQIYDPKTLGMYAYRAPDYMQALRVMDESTDYLEHIDAKMLEKSKAEAISKVHQHYRLLGTPLEKAAAMEYLILWGKSPKEIINLQKEIILATPAEISKKQKDYKEIINEGKTAVMTGKNYTKGQNFTIYRY